MNSLNACSIVTLLTDFGVADSYVAAMKGVILSLAPQATLVDASHEIPPQDIRTGAWVLGQFWKYYPDGTIHVAVVDPGVGTERDALLVEADGHFFLAPDNGILATVLRQASQVKLRKLFPEVHRPGDISATFHGRDIFAYAAGLLAEGKTRPEDISGEMRSVTMPPWSLVRKEGDRLVGEVVHVDRFGNLIANISRRQVEDMRWKTLAIEIGNLEMKCVFTTYSDAPTGELLALYGSSGTLEFAVSGGSAAKLTGLTRGATVIVRKA
jgi:S-adenosyl-L-methionine hydrolase (adenosine-forming)